MNSIYPSSGNGVLGFQINWAAFVQRLQAKPIDGRKFDSVEDWFRHRVQPILDAGIDELVDKCFVDAGERNDQAPHPH